MLEGIRHWEVMSLCGVDARPLSTFKLYSRAVFLLKRLSLSLSPPRLKHTHTLGWCTWANTISILFFFQVIESQMVNGDRSDRYKPDPELLADRETAEDRNTSAAGVHFIHTSHRCSMSGCDSSCGLLLRKMAFYRTVFFFLSQTLTESFYRSCFVT